MTRRGALVLCLLLASCSRPGRVSQRTPAPADLRVTFFDVGQGDGAMLRTPEGKTVVIDTGRGHEFAAQLEAAGVKRIDLLILSHPHTDHAGGFPALARQFQIAEVWYAAKYPARLGREVRAVAGAREVAAGVVKDFGALRLTVLHPEPGAKLLTGGSAVNNASVVVKAQFGAVAYLFPGDCELGCWEELFRNHRAELRADVLKAAHHGSWNGTNSGVLINVRPSVYIISCGRGNTYGHPHEVVLKLVAKLKAQLFRTDESGAILCEGVRCAPARHAAVPAS